MRTPNPEQIIGIEHEGGMILNAGAGSGKTFVLVRHFIYLTEKFLEKNKKLTGEDLSRALAKFFSEMVFMTFTKKAAGELSGRIREAIAEKKADPVWELVESQISHLFVGTIHSFCNRLLTQGYVTEIGPEIKILSDIEFKEKIRTLVREYYEKVGSKNDFSELLLSNLDDIAEGFIDVFNSVELRSKWKSWDQKEILIFESFMEDIFILNEWDVLKRVKKEEFLDFSDKSWAKNISDFIEIINTKGFRDISSLSDYLDFFAGIKTLNKPKEKDNCPLGIEVITKMAEFREVIRKNEDNFFGYFKNPKALLNWATSVKNLFDFIETQIPYHRGLVYSDLEYYVLKGLQNPNIAKRVRENYNYFVIDEFQDTSIGQSKIFELLSGKNLERIFCVGDLKQAIYGFRGGEIEVFLEYLEKMPQKKELKSNYRSKKDVIEFNNNFFEHVFNSSLDYSHRLTSLIPISSQNFPEDSKNQGPGEINSLVLRTDEAVENSQVNRIESFGIIELIKKIMKEHPEEEICVLYRNRAPSMLLIFELLAEKLEFKAQIQIEEESDPIVGIFNTLINAQILKQAGEDYKAHFEIILKSYFDYLNIEPSTNIESLFTQFIQDQVTLGMIESARKFFFALNISNSNYKNNLSNLTSIITLGKEDPESVLNLLEENGKKGYSFEFQMGKGKNLIKIMTVHASKGLEFDHVILGGIHSNEVGKGGLPPLFGKNPGSFLWKKESKERKLLKTPEYFIEQEYKKIKDGFESKRMLYVACTRAKNSLSYVDVFEKGKGPKSWINAFRSFVDTKSLIKTSEINYSLSQIPLRKINRPLFHREDLGIIYKENSKESSHLGILGDISVTSLISLSECPRKFYLKNVCRFDTDNLNQAFDGEELEVVSSSQRGSQIHLEISSKIKQKDFSIHPDSSINFALDYLQTFKSDFEILSEKSFKFPLFGYMCSGIPDAILRPLRDGSFSIIDFKTGNKKEAHIFQLLAYAYGAYQLGMVDKKNKIKLILLYLDLGVTLEVFTDFQKSAEELFKVWKNLYNLDQVNLGHCKECSFHGLCYSSVATP